MKKITVALTVLAIFIPLTLSGQSLGSYFTQFFSDVGVDDITYGIGAQVYYWDPPAGVTGRADVLGSAVLAELGLSVVHLSYYYKTSDLPLGRFIIHQAGLGIRLPELWKFNGELGITAQLDSTLSIVGYAPIVAIEFPLLRMLRTGDYEHALSLRAQTNILNPLGDLGGGVHFSRNFAPISEALSVTTVFADSVPSAKLAGWFDEKKLAVNIKNASRMKMKNVKIMFFPVDNSKQSWFDITVPQVTELDRKSTTPIDINIRSLERLSHEKVDFILEVSCEGRGGSAYSDTFEIVIPTTPAEPPPIPAETPAGLI